MRWCQYRRSPARRRCGLGFCRSAKIGDGTGHGDSGAGGGRVLYDKVHVTEVVDDECISAESDVGREDRGDQGRFGGDDDSSV